MTAIITRELGATAKGSPLTNAEGDTNLINLNSDKSEKYIQIKNTSGFVLSPGNLVYITGSTGENVTVALASASSEAASSKTFAMVQDTIGINATGRAVSNDYVTGLDTSAILEGAGLWLNTTAGTYSTTKPTAPNHSVFVGYVVRSHASEGVILVKIQNGYELEELHNVLISSVADGDVLIYDNATSLWKNFDKSSARTKLELYSKTETTNRAIAMAIALG